MKKRLKSFYDFENNKVIEESLNAASRQMAQMTMGGDPNQVRQTAQAAGFNTEKARRIMMKWLADIEGKLGGGAPQSGEEAVEKFHPQAVQILQNILGQAASGKRQWGVQQQARGLKKANMPTQQPQVQQPPQGGPTPLSAIK